MNRRTLVLTSASAALLALPTLAHAAPVNKAGSLKLLTSRVEVSDAGHRTSEFTVARDPKRHDHLVAAAMDWDGPNGTVSCVSFVSRDGGTSWKAGAVVPQFSDQVQHVDPWVTIDGSGTAIMSCIGQYASTGTGIERRLQVSRSTDGGDTWSAATPVRTALGKGTATKDSLYAAPAGTLYACFKEDDLEVVRSTDQGKTWLAPKVFTGMQATCNGFAGTPRGDVLVNWQGSGGTVPANSFGALKTADGLTWTKANSLGDTGAVPSDPPFPQNAAPSIAASPTTGHVFIAAQTYVPTAGATSTQSHALVDLVGSSDGVTYKPITLPTFPSTECADCNQVHPALTVDDTGRLAFEVTLSDDQSLVREVWMAVSPDEGKSWYAPIMLGDTDSSDSYVAPSDLTPDAAHLASGIGATATGSPTDLASSGLGVASETIWPYFHRDGGEYFGITSTSKGIVAGWDDHYGDGRAAVWSRLVQVRSASAATPVTVKPAAPAKPVAAPTRPTATSSLPTTGLAADVSVLGLLLLAAGAALRRRTA